MAMRERATTTVKVEVDTEKAKTHTEEAGQMTRKTSLIEKFSLATGILSTQLAKSNSTR